MVKVNGSAVFGLDVRPPGLVYAAVRMCPVFGGTLQKLDTDAVTTMPGVLRVVVLSRSTTGAPAGVAVIAKTWWQAKLAVAALPVVWDEGPHAKLSSEEISRELADALDAESGFTYYRTGDQAAAQNAVKKINADYAAPFLAHAALEPVNCTAQVKDGKLTLWVSTQVPTLAVSAAAKAAQLAPEQVTLHATYIGGGFGRRLETDMVTQAVAIALEAAGAPVQVIWDREQDIAHDVYRPAALARFSAALDAAGNVVAYESKSASGSVSQHMMRRAFGLPEIGPDKSTVEGVFDQMYEFPNQRIAHVIVPSAV
ncbi:MAG: molybdopterin cofactor-binding domain-containing protein, partial [Noviherbaspirillum sp.]